MDTDVTVRDVITREYVGVSESDTVRDTVELMRREHASSVLVLRGDEPVGIMTEYDVLGVVENGEDPEETPVSAVMSSPVRSVPGDTELRAAAGRMSGENIRNLIVEDDGETVGVLTDRDVIAAVASLQRTPAGRPSTGTLARDTEAGGAAADGRAETVTQGVCETCGALTDQLHDRNGQLVCANCREV
jgi:CBS domain-containing protein